MAAKIIVDGKSRINAFSQIPSKPGIYGIRLDNLLGVYLAREHWLLEKLKQRARHLKVETFALYLAARHPRTPWYAKLLVAGIVSYAFSPIDLVPDFIPVIGYLDDLILVPLGLALAIRMVPDPVLTEC